MNDSSYFRRKKFVGENGQLRSVRVVRRFQISDFLRLEERRKSGILRFDFSSGYLFDDFRLGETELLRHRLEFFFQIADPLFVLHQFGRH